MNLGGGGALAEEPLMLKLEFREKKCLESFWSFTRAWTWLFRENRVIYTGNGDGRPLQVFFV